MSKKEDLRVVKTHKALINAMFSLLCRRNFNDITINDLCSEALVSRATFYTHFNDKYDLFKYFLRELRKNIVKDVFNYEDLERDINQFVNPNKNIIRNILKEANSETLALVRDFMSSIITLAIKRNTSNETGLNHVVLFNFIIGGLVNHLTWMVDNDFPPGINMMNPYLYKMLQALTAWDAEQETEDNIQ